MMQRVFVRCGLLAFYCLGLCQSVWGANTPGTVSFEVATVTANGKYAPKHVLAIWVADSKNNFVRTLKFNAAARVNYLNKWNAARGATTGGSTVDGYSGATLSSHQTHRVTWNCKTAAGAVVADGTYRIFVEFTEVNGQGPLLSTVTIDKGTSAATNTFASASNFTKLRVVYTPAAPDIAVIGLTPGFGLSDSVVPVQVLVTNMSASPATFTVALTNLTAGSRVGGQLVSGLPASALTNVVLEWNIANLALGNYLLQASASPVAGEMLTDDNVLSRSFLVRDPRHNVGIAQILAPVSNLPDAAINVGVAVTNSGDFQESFGVTLTDSTDGRFIGSNYVSKLAPLSSATVNFSWKTIGSALGYHTLQAVADAVSEETLLSDNTNTVTVVVAPGTETVTLIPAGSLWRYNDQGLNLAETPWTLASYYDRQWGEGPAPLGYSDNNGHTNIATKVGFGPNASAKYPTCYFRHRFQVDFPMLSVSGRFRRDDGFVMFLNGHEVFRTNMPAGMIAYTNYANYTVSGSAQYAYYGFTLSPTNLILGENLLAAEVHQVNATSSDIVWDLELTGTRPKIPVSHDVAVSGATPRVEVVIGDKLSVGITLTNRGNVTESFLVYLRDTADNRIVASQAVDGLAPHSSTTAKLEWPALGLAPGDHVLQAFTVVNGVTNAAGAVTTQATIRDAGIGLNAVNAVGGIGGFCAASALWGDYTLLGSGATLEVINVANPIAPVRVGSIRLPGMINQIVVSGSHAYAACGKAGVQVVDIANPAKPAHTRTLSSAGHAYGVAIAQDLLCVADGRAGVRVFNVENPDMPVFMGSHLTEGPARAVAFSGSNVAVLDAFTGLQLVSAANAKAPARIGGYNGILDGRALCVSGNRVYIVDGQGRFYLVSIEAASAPVLTASLLLDAIGESVAVNGTTAYVAAGGKGMLTINCATASAPVVSATNAVPGSAACVAANDKIVCLADGFAGFQTLNIAHPTAPVLLGDFPVAIRASDVTVAGGIACVAGGEAGVRIYSVTNPAAPVLLGVLAEAKNARCIALSSSIAFIGDGPHGLKVANIALPEKPTLIGSWSSTNLSYARSIAVSGSKVALTDGRVISLLDAGDPANPVLVDAYPAPAFAYKLAADDGKLYVAFGSYGLLVLNMAGNKLTFLGRYDTAGLANGIAVSGKQAYVADGPVGWLVLDVSNPAAPALIRASAGEGPVVDIAVSGVLACLADGETSARAMNVSAPLSPVSMQAFSSLVRAMRIATAGSHAFVAEDDAGLAVLSLGTVEPVADSDQDGMPDAWEQQVIDISASTNGPIRTFASVLPQDDFDGDGFSNYQEYLAGTSPIDAGSVFALLSMTSSTGNFATVSWRSAIGKQYTVYKSTNLLTGFYAIQMNVPAEPPVNTYTDTNAVDNAYYIIGVQ